MPIFFLVIAVLLIAAGINNKTKELGGLIGEAMRPSDGSPSFMAWILALLLVGSLGYVAQFKPVANALIALILVVLLLSNKGFFEKFTTALNEG